MNNPLLLCTCKVWLMNTPLLLLFLVTEEEEGKDLLRDKVSLYKGDITILEVDAIVNAGTVLCY